MNEMGVRPMNCPRCNAEVVDSATFCQQCGSTIRPVSFSYLPAGAPPWPTSTAQLPAYVGTLPQSGSNGSGTATATQTSTFPSREGGVATQKPERPRRLGMGVFALIGIFVLTGIVGTGATLLSLYANGQIGGRTPTKIVSLPKATPTAAAPATTPGTGATPAATATGTTNVLPTPTAFQNISSKGSSSLQVTLKFPSDWVEDAPQTSTDETSIAFHPLQQIPVFIGVSRVSTAISASITSPNDINQLNFSGLQGSQGVSNFQIVNPVTAQRAVGGEQWAEQDATFDVTSSTNNLEFHATTMATKHNQTYYSIIFYAPSQVYGEAMQKYFQPIFDSFKFQ